MVKTEIIQKILREYEYKKGIAEQKRLLSIEEAYKKCPALLELDKEINRVGYEAMHSILDKSKSSESAKKEMDDKMAFLLSKKENLLKENNISSDYNKTKYECIECSDTGYTPDSKKCRCFQKRISELFYEESQFGNMIDGADFKNFDLSYYESSDKESREIIEDALIYAKDFCQNFDNINYNLFFYGRTGLGKTFLSSIIAKNLMDKGKNVSYVRATRMFTLYDDYKFKDYSLKPLIDELYNCDLLVIDDLGTEFLSKTSLSFLFDLINDRLINGKKIIINTNVDIKEFSNNYTVRLTSRIYDCFKIFRFSGDDIRIKKLIQG